MGRATHVGRCAPRHDDPDESRSSILTMTSPITATGSGDWFAYLMAAGAIPSAVPSRMLGANSF